MSASPAGTAETGTASAVDGSRLAGMDGLRAVAALAVLGYHTLGALNLHRTADFGGITARMGNQGVAVFFVLSGFLLHLPFVGAYIDARPLPRLPAFYWRRAVRIFPAYWLAFSTYVAFGFMSLASLWDAFLYYGLLHVYDGRRVLGGLGVSWTLCVELSFYLLLPLLTCGLGRFAGGRSRERRLWASLAAVSLLYLVGTLYRVVAVQSAQPPPALSVLPAMLDWFALGMGLAVLRAAGERSRAVPALVATLVRIPALSWLLAAELFWVVVQFDLPRGFEPATSLQRLGAHPFVGLAAFFFVLPVALQSGSRLPSPLDTLNSPVVRRLGLISYGIFLWHRIWIAVVLDIARDRGWQLSFLELLPLILVLTLASATVSFIALERPLSRLVRGTHQRGRRRRRSS